MRKELEKRIAELEQENAALKKEVERLNDWVDGLKKSNWIYNQEIVELAAKLATHEKFVKNAQK